MIKTNKNKTINNSQAGFSLVELLIAVTVFLIVMSAVYGLLKIGIISRNTINHRTETITNARTAVNTVGKDIVNAGLGFTRVGGIVPDDFFTELLDLKDDGGSQRDLLTGIIAGNNIKESDISKNGTKNDVVAFAFRDLSFNNGKAVSVTDAPISSVLNNSVVLKTAAGDCANCNPYDLYLVESTDGKQAMVMATSIPDTNTIVLGVGDPLGINQPVIENSDKRSVLIKCILGNTVNCMNYDTGVTIKKVYWISFSVEADGTLVRTSYGNNTGANAFAQIQKQPIAYGVQNFQVRYLMQDGSVTDDPAQDNKYPMKMNEVVQVEVSLTLKSATGNNSVTNKDLINVTSTFSTRNLKYGIG
jgi:prepilin-type N-terminal cleavage/methylation domain-containing protein